MITPDMINQAPTFINEQNQRQINLRNHKITTIASMSSALNYFQCIDLSDNSIRLLGNFTFMDHLVSLIAANNMINSLDDISKNLPNLKNLFLMNNKISKIVEIYKLSKCHQLKRLTLVGNPVTEIKNYRQITISAIPSLQILDFKKITGKERKEADLVKKSLSFQSK